VLNALWVGFFLVAIAASLWQFVVHGQADIFAQVMQASFASAKTGFEIALGLTGVMCLWLGLMRVGERAGFLQAVTRLLEPLLARVFPEVPRGHPALGSMTMNLSANVLGLDNAATPMGIKAMHELQTLNKTPESASNAMILFLVINASSVTLLPITIFTYRAQMGAADPTDVFIPILMATYASTMAGFLTVAAIQRLPVFNVVVMAWLMGLTLAVGAISAWFLSLSAEQVTVQSALISNLLLLGIIAAFLIGASARRVNAYEAFIDGAKEGFQTAITIIPYLVAMLVAIGLLRASGVLEAFTEAARAGVAALGADARWVDALPTMIMKPLSGSGSRAMMIEAMQTHGADSYIGRLVCIVQGSTETTFYVLAVYLGAAVVKRARHAITGCIAADLAGFVVAVWAAGVFFA
jgi:spore maturation protein SpmA